MQYQLFRSYRPSLLKTIYAAVQNIVKYLTEIFMLKTFLNTLPLSLQDPFTLGSSKCCKTRGDVFNFYLKYASTRKKQLCI